MTPPARPLKDAERDRLFAVGGLTGNMPAMLSRVEIREREMWLLKTTGRTVREWQTKRNQALEMCQTAIEIDGPRASLRILSPWSMGKIGGTQIHMPHISAEKLRAWLTNPDNWWLDPFYALGGVR